MLASSPCVATPLPSWPASTWTCNFAMKNHRLPRINEVIREVAAETVLFKLRDPRVRENEAYLTVILLSRVVVRLGSLGQVTPQVIEGMFASDLAFLQSWGTGYQLGPGSIRVAHTDEEHVHKRDLVESVALYVQLARDLVARDGA